MLLGFLLSLSLSLTLTLPPTLLSEIGSWGPEDRFWCFSCPSDANRGFVSKQQKLKVRERAAAAAAASVQPRQGTSARLRKLNRPKEKEEKQRTAKKSSRTSWSEKGLLVCETTLKMPFTPISAPKCPACKTNVYPAEQVRFTARLTVYPQGSFKP